MLKPLTVVFHLSVTVLAAGLASAQENYAQLFADGQASAILAHRSAEIGGQPENTLAWIEEAIAQGIDVIHINQIPFLTTVSKDF